MPESPIPKPNYIFCQFVYPESGHDGGPCDCFHTPSQKRVARAKARLARLRANKKQITRASTSKTQESTVASDPAVTRPAFSRLGRSGLRGEQTMVHRWGS